MNKPTNPPIQDLHGVPQTLLAALACRAIETARPDALLCDPGAGELLSRLGGGGEIADE